MTATFCECINLVSSIEINANPQFYSDALHDSNVTKITGTTELKEEILNSCSCM